MSKLTEEDIEFIAKTFGLTRVKTETIKVFDGEAKIGDKLWWKCAAGAGPEHIVLNDNHWRNAREFPNLYSIKQPRFIVQTRIKYFDLKEEDSNGNED